MLLIIKSPHEIGLALRDRIRARRLTLNLSQAGLAERAGVNLYSLRRFESTGRISFESLLKIALVLDCLQDFEQVAASPAVTAQSLDQVLARPRKRNRGRLK